MPGPKLDILIGYIRSLGEMPTGEAQDSQR